jgi:N-acetylglucosaminyl-diphospho-decaprenol L-rhamnosyltransferase
VDFSYCVVNTAGRAHLMRGLAAIRDTLPEGVDAEVLVLDNASGDGSAEVVREWNEGPEGFGERLRLFALDRRQGKADNDSFLIAESQGEWCLLLNEDSEIRPGAVEQLLGAVEGKPKVAVAGAQLLAEDGSRSACAWRFPGVGTALAQALFLHRIFVTQSGGAETRQVDWVQSAAMLVRRDAAAEVGYLDADFFVYSDETEFQKRLADAGWEVLYVPGAEAIHHEQLTNDRVAGRRRLVEFHRNRDLYMRKHHGAASAAAVRVLTAWNYAVRALVALVRPGQDAGWFWLHARLAFKPEGDGIREAAGELNARLDREAAAGDKT